MQAGGASKSELRNGLVLPIPIYLGWSIAAAPNTWYYKRCVGNGLEVAIENAEQLRGKLRSDPHELTRRSETCFTSNKYPRIIGLFHPIGITLFIVIGVRWTSFTLQTY